MTWQLILVCISFLIFLAYNISILAIFKPENVWSLSRSYYLLEDKKKGLGNLFTGFMLTIAMTLMPAWIEIATNLEPWMSYLSCLSFITAACIAFVGIAPRYREEMEGKVHNTVARISAATALIWCFATCWKIWYIPVIGVAIAGILGFCFKGWKKCRDYWLEMMAFYATYLTVIFSEIMLN